MQVNRRLYRCRHDQRISGVASGVAEYLDVDPTVVRVLWVLSIFLGGFGLLLYIAMAIIVPLEPEETVVRGAEFGPEGASEGQATPDGTPGQSPAGRPVAASMHRHAGRQGDGRATTFIGAILILFGSLALLDAVLPDWADGGRFLWPAFILGIGVLLVLNAVRREPNKP
jgi:phage shock protein C